MLTHPHIHTHPHFSRQCRHFGARGGGGGGGLEAGVAEFSKEGRSKRPMRAPKSVNMPVRVESWKEGEDARAFAEIIDVRSPAEFAEDHIPGAINMPCLTNEQRHEVGARNDTGW